MMVRSWGPTNGAAHIRTVIGHTGIQTGIHVAIQMEIHVAIQMGIRSPLLTRFEIAINLKISNSKVVSHEPIPKPESKPECLIKFEQMYVQMLSMVT